MIKKNKAWEYVTGPGSKCPNTRRDIRIQIFVDLAPTICLLHGMIAPRSRRLIS